MKGRDWEVSGDYCSQVSRVFFGRLILAEGLGRGTVMPSMGPGQSLGGKPGSKASRSSRDLVL